MSTHRHYQIDVQVQTLYLEEESNPEESRYVFAYTITMTNSGDIAAKLISRHWIVTDANNKVQEIRGEGVVGAQPHIRPGESFRYTSATMIETPVGCMQGSYQMVADDGHAFDAPIAVFNLSTPNILH
jgi:ApaG protein